MDRFHQSMSWNQPKESGASGDQSSGGYPASSSQQADPSSTEGAFQIDHGSWSHSTSHRCFFLPIHYTPGYAYPLVIWLHSNGFNENQIDDVMPYISLRNYVGAGIRGTRAADSAGHRFDWHQSPAAIAGAHEAVCEAIDEAERRFSIDPARIVLAGYRDGGTMALRIAMRQPRRFGGAISMGGRLPRGAIRNLSELRQRRLPMLWQWGRSNVDFTVDNLNTDCRCVMATGGQVEVRQYPGSDEMDTVVLRDADEWIMRRIVANSAVAGADRWVSSPNLYSSN